MSGCLRFVAGLLLLPACWAATSVLFDVVGSAGSLGVCTFSFIGGIVVFALFWMFAPHPVKTYVFGHELTHALWGVLFGARPSRLRVGDTGGSVILTKTNVFITLAPYFFPFYTFIVLLAAAITAFFVRPLPCLPAWLFAVGLTWAFHILFTIQSLGQYQPDVQIYGRVFSWAFIYLANVLLVLVVLVLATDCGFIDFARSLGHELIDAYAFTCSAIVSSVRYVVNLFTS